MRCMVTTRLPSSPAALSSMDLNHWIRIRTSLYMETPSANDMGKVTPQPSAALWGTNSWWFAATRQNSSHGCMPLGCEQQEQFFVVSIHFGATWYDHDIFLHAKCSSTGRKEPRELQSPALSSSNTPCLTSSMGYRQKFMALSWSMPYAPDRIICCLQVLKAYEAGQAIGQITSEEVDRQIPARNHVEWRKIKTK